MHRNYGPSMVTITIFNYMLVTCVCLISYRKTENQETPGYRIIKLRSKYRNLREFYCLEYLVPVV